jgi:hypothetical protein
MKPGDTNKVICVYNPSDKDITIKSEAPTEAADYRFYTGGSDVTLGAGKVKQMVYVSTVGWFLIS